MNWVATIKDERHSMEHPFFSLSKKRDHKVSFVAAIAPALAMLLFVPLQAWSGMLRGATSASPARCLLCIIFFAVVPFVALIWALRQGAPTRLTLSGATAGVVAGGLGAAAYAFNCTSDTIPFIAVCYGAAIALVRLSERNLDLVSFDGNCHACDIVIAWKM